jgi:2-haloacid dehalogenase
VGVADSYVRGRVINRGRDRPGWGATPEPEESFSYDLEFGSMAAFADAVDEAFGD